MKSCKNRRLVFQGYTFLLCLCLINLMSLGLVVCYQYLSKVVQENGLLVRQNDRFL